MLAGLTDKQMSDVMNVSVSAIADHKKNNPAFMEAYQRGKILADMKVAEGLYQNTQDRYVDDEQISVWKGEVIRIPIKRFIQGDKIAQLKWLAARQPEQWRESQTMNVNRVNTNINVDFTGFTIEEMLQLEKIGFKQLPEHNSSNE